MDMVELWIARNRFLAGVLAGALFGLALLVLMAALREPYYGEDDGDGGESVKRPDITPIVPETPPVSPLPPHLEIINQAADVVAAAEASAAQGGK